MLNDSIGKGGNMNEGGNRAGRSNRKRFIVLVVVLIAATAVALTVGLVLHYQINDEDGKGEKDVTTSRMGVLVDCLPELRRNEEKMSGKEDECQRRGCLWRKLSDKGAPWCTYPRSSGYILNGAINETNQSYSAELTRSPAALASYQEPVYDLLSVHIEWQTENRVRVKITPKNVQRWELPASILNIESSNGSVNKNTSLYTVTFTDRPWGVAITRKSSGSVIFNSSFPGMLLSDQFLQLTTRLPNENVYGFGEHRHESFKHDMNWRLWSMFTRDSGPNSDWNLYGQHPVYMNVEDDGQANMVLLKNTNAMEVLLQPNPDPAITYITIGGVLDFYIFLGSSPSDVVKHYIQAIGKPVFPPYWSLGFHLCRWGYRNITDMEMVIERNRAAQIPYDPGIGSNDSIIQEIQRDWPAYNMTATGYEADIFVKAADNSTLVGEVWPGVTVYPDFTNDNIQDWWTHWIRFYRESVGVDVDALWIDMNEPSNFVKGSVKGCNQNNLNYPVYRPHLDGVEEKGELFVKTLCMDSQQTLGRHYDVHSLYAHTMAVKTYRSLESLFPGQRPWTMTRSSFVGTGHYATKWQGDNQAQWSNMHYSIISLMEFGLFGFPMNGADICGFWLEPSYEMCVRWHQLGAFYPFARNHNGKGDDPVVFKHQDPASFGQDFVNLVRPVLMTRYKFLPYLYTQMYRAHAEGETVFKPLFFEFASDTRTLSIDKQFMLGPAFLISPVLEDNVRMVKAYFPNGRWFDYINGEEINSVGQNVDLITPLNKFNLHIRGGYIVPWQTPNVTTEDSRTNDLGLLVALGPDNTASGEMFWDDGKSIVNETNYNLIKFDIIKAGELTIRIFVKSTTNIGGQLHFKTIEIYGLSRLPQNFAVNGHPLPSSNIKVYNNIIYLMDLPNLPMTLNSTVTWSIG
ncbi:sucrase-isomaltase, intestinal-like isoform X2 [Biomphalaria glabrata]|uniref:Maltase n=1 Tax=Biomphalaria glabrata TaxID=6526 RepID=A0A9W2Z169_BIOGL|nr:sucrase-isomaltase, intestinal-like isoform X2 [Biomphalaria glabrata]